MRKRKTPLVIPDLEWLRKTFEYREGQLINRSTNKPIGSGKRYKVATINYQFYLLHHLIWYYRHGEWPTQLDHKDQDKLNNRIENLRNSDKSLNEANTGPRVTNTTGYKGVSFLKRKKPCWRVTIASKHIGVFYDIKEAAEAYNREAIKLYGDFAYLNNVT